MGYEVHITRKVNWFDESGAVISEDECFAKMRQIAEKLQAMVQGDE